jgi:hypothetical protein
MSDAAAPPNAAAASSANAAPPPDDLGPFAPPAGFEFPPELQGPAPRSIPAFLRAGRHGNAWRKGLLLGAEVSLVCLVAQRLDFVQQMAVFIPPLEWLTWIGAGGLSATVGAWLWMKLAPSRFDCVAQGKPFAARVRQVGLIAEAQPGGGAYYKMAADLEFPHPETGHMMTATTVSDPVSPYGIINASRYRCLLQPGDYATAVYLPAKGIESLRLYGFLGLNPEIEFLLKDGQPIRPQNAVSAGLFGMVALVGLLGGAMWLFHAFERLAPVEPNYLPLVGLILGSFLGLSLLMGALVHAANVRAASMDASPRKRLQESVVGGAAFGFVLALFVAMPALFTLNAKLGQSPNPEFRLVEIADFWQETWMAMVRRYRIEYREVSSGQKSRYPSMPSQMAKFHKGGLAFLEIHPGAFGGRWIRDIHPLDLDGQMEANPDGSGAKLVVRVGANTADHGFRAVSLGKEERALVVTTIQGDLDAQLQASFSAPAGASMPKIAVEIRDAP